MPISLNKEDCNRKINLRKEKINKICLSKANLKIAPQARVAVVMDYSGSMHRLYKDGTVQDILERLFPLALQFDDNGELEVWIFDDKYHRITPMNQNNAFGYVQKEILSRGYHMGGTCYSPVINNVRRKYINEEPAKLPEYVIFITDGANSDKSETKHALIEASKEPIFWQFVGIGSEPKKFLEKLDTLNGRYVDNANFFDLNDINTVSDDELYSRLLTEYPDWVAMPEVQELIQRQEPKKGLFNRMLSGFFG